MNLEHGLELIEHLILAEAFVLNRVGAGIRGAWKLSGHDTLRGLLYYFTSGKRQREKPPGIIIAAREEMATMKAHYDDML